MTLHAYLPQDRLRALARGETLPDRTTGAALFADISGFTPLTEGLHESLGPRRGGEELTRQLDAVYTALIAEVERYGGSVIGFAGDAITCWFDDSNTPAAPRATTCALALQQVMLAFQEIVLPNGAVTALALKVAVAVGPARRFVVGDPNIHYLDALAGGTVARMSMGEHLAQRGEVVVDEATVKALGPSLSIREWRNAAESGARFAVVDHYAEMTPPVEQPPLPECSPEQLRHWLHKSQVKREPSFLTEFRPCAALFVRFRGIDYDAADAQPRLDSFIQQMQAITARYEGAVLQLTIGDKGSYVYLNFGALSAHEDDARRAVKVALDLQQAARALGFLAPLQLGITQGIMRVGACGGKTRRTYGALGDEVNLAARLMQTAGPGEILVSGHVHKAVEHHFVFEPRLPLLMKGKADPVPVFAVTGERQQRAIRLQEPTYALPMVGRQIELQRIGDKLAATLQGQSQIIGISAEAGMGKSRLVAEVIRAARKKGFAGYGGACQSDGVNTPYLAWKAIWSAFFDIDPAAPVRKQIRLLEGEIEDRAPERVAALPLLGALLNLDIPENDFTKTLEPKDRKSVLHALLEDCLKAAVKDEPLLIILEDLHWIDPLSHDLLEELARSLTGRPICFVLAYRPPATVAQSAATRLEALPNFTRIELRELDPAECEQAIHAKLAQLYPARTGAAPRRLVDKLMTRSQGNPFYLEELLNYLRDRGLDPRESSALDKIDLPDSLHALILSRIDQLTEREKTTLRVASIVGRLFRADWLAGYYPALGTLPQVKADLDKLHVLDITPQDAPEPELAYLFKHIITHEVTYESLPFATRAQLHEQLAHYLEATYSNDLPIDALAFHYSHSHNLPKKREYLRKAGEKAQAAYSNAAAVEYYKQALACSPAEEESVTLHLNSGSIYQLIGEWDEAQVHYQQALQIATTSQLTQRIIECEINLGNAWILRADYPQALECLEKARLQAVQSNDLAGICAALCEMGIVHWRLANFDTATHYLQQGIDLARHRGDKKKEAYALSVLGQVKAQVGKFAEGHHLLEAALTLATELNDKRRMAGALNNLATTYYYEGDYELAQKLLEEGLATVGEIGDKRGVALTLNNLGSIFYLKNDFNAARKYYEASLALGRETDDKYIKSVALSSLGITVFRLGQLREADLFYQESLALSREMGDKVGLSLLQCYFGLLALAQDQPGAARRSFGEGLIIAHQNEIKSYAIYNLIGLACVLLAEGQAASAVNLLAVSLEITKSTGLKIEPELQEPYDKAILKAEKTLSRIDFQSAWEVGQRLTLAEAIKLALAEPNV